MNIGIIGCGSIAEKMVLTVSKMKGVSIYAVSSRDILKANAFAEKFKIHNAFGSYEEMLKDDAVELVYIATPHSHHFEHAKLCLKYKKPVLCEKAFALNSTQSKKIISLFEKEKVFITEAIWTRYMPSRKMIDDIIKSGIIGKVTNLTANLSYAISDKERIKRPELAGGALLDVGVYGLNFAFMHFGKDIKKIVANAQMTKTGVDGADNISIYYKDGRSAFITAGIYARSDRKGIFWGEKGYIVVENINNPQSINVYDLDDKLIESVKVPKQITGYEYEVYESIESIKKRKLESKSMPHDETVFVMKVMDDIRKQIGLVYPQEKK